MAPVRFIGPPDLSGRTPIYRLAKTVVAPAAPPPPHPSSQPQPSPSQVNNAAHPQHSAPYQPPYHPHAPPPPPPQSQSHPHPSPYNSPYNSSQPPPQSTPQENKENVPALTKTPQGTPAHGTGTGTPSSARGSPLTKRRGRKLQESEVLILVNCCLEYQSIFHDNPTRFWYCVGVSLKRQIKRNFSWQSCRQIIEELVSERRERRRDVAAGKAKEQPMTDLVLATDKWISVCDAFSSGGAAVAGGGGGGAPTPGTVQSLKRPGQSESPTAEGNNSNAAKRPKPNDQVATRSHPPPPPPPTTHAATGPPMPYPPYPPYPMPPHHMPSTPIPTIPSGPTMAEFQTLKVDIQSLRMDVQGMRRDMIEVRNDINAKLDLILKTLQEGKETKEDKEDKADGEDKET
ncbi:hypothetical protein BJX65DRAFT_194533 [Aspergillus insuetus]